LITEYHVTMKAALSRSRSVRHFDSLEQEAYLSLWRTYDRLRAYEDELFAQWGLTNQQYNVLRLLKGAHPEAVPTLTLVSRLVSRAPDITRMLDKLEERKLISRSKRKTDRRSVFINITARGLKLLEMMAEPLRECHEKQLGHLSGAELKTLIQLLQRVRQPHEAEGSPWS
jgi:DNA-binding MarR family transcriptional regulator